MLAICNNLGILQKPFFPNDSGCNYTPSPYLELLQEHRSDFTSLEGVWNPDCDGGHPADICFLTAAPHPGRGNFRNTISLDQLIAERIGHLTRHPYLALGINVEQGLRSVCWTSNGVLIPPEEKIAAVFRRLFVQGTDSEAQAQLRRLELGESILDAVANQAKRLQKQLGARDRNRLDQYFTSVRDLEQRMHMSKAWENKPKPVVNVDEPVEPSSRRQFFEKLTLQYDLARLAFETDQTRVITIFMDSVNSPAMNLKGTRITDGYHNLSHHGRSTKKLEQLTAIDKQHMTLLAKLFSDLKAVTEDGETLLDRTMVLFGSNLGDADAHVNTNVPTLFAGGGFRHGQHLAFDTQFNYPLPQPVRLDAPADGNRTGPFRDVDRHNARTGTDLVFRSLPTAATIVAPSRRSPRHAARPSSDGTAASIRAARLSRRPQCPFAQRHAFPLRALGDLKAKTIGVSSFFEKMN